jgi:2-dehydropantoate 2-reductase
MAQPVWHILGAGAIGSLFACAFSQAGCESRLITRRVEIDTRPTQNINLSSRFGVQACQPSLSPAQDNTPIEHLLITTKAYDVRKATATVAHRLTPHTRVVLMVNGMGIREELEADHPHLDIYCATTTEGAYRTADRGIVHAGSGLTQLGRAGTETAPPWFANWQNTPLACLWVNNIEQTLWEKLAVNCAINPLTAINRCRNGALAEEPSQREKLAGLCEEIATVTAALGYQRLAQQLQERVLQVVQATAGNRSSMLQDVMAGRATEIDYITGYLVRTASSHGIPVPLNSAISEEVRKLGP